jgi:hypothetical protein
LDYPSLKLQRFNGTSVLLSVVGGPSAEHPNLDESWTGNVSEDGVLTIPDEVWNRLGWEVEDTVEWVDSDDDAFYLVKVDEQADTGDESADVRDDAA